MNSSETARFLDTKPNTLYIKIRKGQLPFMQKREEGPLIKEKASGIDVRGTSVHQQ